MAGSRGVQIIEVTDLTGVRSAVHTFGRAETPLCFMVFPMIHLADPIFYGQVTTRLKQCDLVIAEGVTGNSLRLRALTSTYRWLASTRRLGLAEQDIDLDPLGVPVVCPDISAAELDRSWRERIPGITSLVVWLLVPVLAVGMRLFGTRRFIARHLEMDDLPASREVLASDQIQDIMEVIGSQRDRPLVEALTSVHEERGEEQIKVAVVYGARHVPAVVSALHLLGYRHRGAEWLTVFTLGSSPPASRHDGPDDPGSLRAHASPG
jgi:hypothetical protein